jgi:ABC-type histidine transport system ATPase subunit
MDWETQDTNETSLYCITFLLTNVYKDSNWNHIWVMGNIMNMLITHKNKTKKYVYDETANEMPRVAIENDQHDLQFVAMRQQLSRTT